MAQLQLLRLSMRPAWRKPRCATFHVPRQKYQTSKTSRTTAPATKVLTSVEQSTHVLPPRHRSRLPACLSDAFTKSQRKRPYTTQVISSIIIFFIGDLSAQKIKGDSYDPQRALRAMVIGAGSSIPIYEWIMFLGNNFNYPSKVLSIVTKIIVNQTFFTPVNNLYYFSMHSLLAGNSLADTWEHLKRTVPTSIYTSCQFWPIMTAFSFTFIEPQYRSVCVGLITIGWQTYLSYLNRKSEADRARRTREMSLENPTQA
ncbi:hypothetical protein K3495_g6648 [Podosphaera aphanis]|nr:hypothetical protein K3495_g6648 [Podosphaera aphanis]